MQSNGSARRTAIVLNKCCLRRPTASDGIAVYELVSRCPPLDTNSLYCNLLQCSLLAATCVAAERDQRLVGFISALTVPSNSDALFVWQVAVAPELRGKGLALSMLLELLSRPECSNVRQLQTSITPGNTASWALFGSLAKTLDARLCSQSLFDQEQHFGEQHETEMLVTLGGIAPGAADTALTSRL